MGAYAANGISDGLQSEYAVAGTWYSQENAVVINMITQNVGRFVSAPLARHFVSTGGQNYYALGQTLLCSCSLCGAFLMWREISGSANDDDDNATLRSRPEGLD